VAGEAEETGLPGLDHQAAGGIYLIHDRVGGSLGGSGLDCEYREER
jgi:hypothetical protein